MLLCSSVFGVLANRRAEVEEIKHKQAERQKMEALKAQGREKTATCRQYPGNRLFYNQLFALYRQYGLIGQRGE